MVSTYLSLRDVHVTRAPEDATVTGRTTAPALIARPSESRAHENERLSWRLDDRATGRWNSCSTPVPSRAGSCRTNVPGAEVTRGARIGLIRFGSRVDVTLPAGVLPLVVVGDRVRAGRTPIAEVSRR